MYHNKPSRKACIATALGLVALLAVAPTAAAEDTPTVEDDGRVSYGECFEINPWVIPPAIYISPLDCIPI